MSQVISPVPAHRLVAEAFRLYRRYPLLFFLLGAGVIVPYQVIVLVLTGAGPFGHGSLSFGAGLALDVTDLALITPLVSALHMHAVREVRKGGQPRLPSVARQGLAALPVVAAASIVSWLGILLGFLVLIVPGVILTLRWSVVAQVAAIDNAGWLPALRRSRRLTAGHYVHVFATLIYVVLIASLPTYLIGLALGHDSTDAGSFLLGLCFWVFGASFAALVTALLYYDLQARLESLPALASSEDASAASSGAPPAPQGSWDPRPFSTENRPAGWYVDPDAPHRMRFWEAGASPGWSGATTRTPRKIRSTWTERRPG